VKPLLTRRQWRLVYEEARRRKLTLPEVPKLVREMFGLEISYKTVWKWIRGKLKLPYSKPFVLDSRRPEDAEEQLRSELVEQTRDLDEAIVVFMDETSIQERGNTVRILGGGKLKAPRRNKKFYLIGGLALNGASYAIKANKANKETFSRFLIGLRKANPLKPIILILDNASFHWAADPRWVARQLDLRLTYLPPYLPDLNPIEFLWRDLKKTLALKTIEEKEGKALETFYSLSSDRRYTYTKSWLEKYGEIIDHLIAIKSTLKKAK